MQLRPLYLSALLALPALSACSGGGASNAVLPNSPVGQSVPGPGGFSPSTVGADPLSSPAGYPTLVALSAAPGKVGLKSVVRANVATGTSLFSDTFASGAYGQFTTVQGLFAGCVGMPQLCTLRTNNEALAGNVAWTDYTASTTVTIDKLNTIAGARSGADLVFRATDSTHFYELELVNERDATKQWQLWKRGSTGWSNLARGLYDFTTGTPYGLRVTAIGSTFVASISTDGGTTYTTLGSATDTAYAAGQIGVRAWDGATSSFSHVTVTAENGATPPPSPSPMPSASATPIAVGAVPTMTPIPPGSPPDDAYTIKAPTVPVPETTPGPLCVAGGQYAYVQGDDFTQETQAQLTRYTTAWEINQYEYNNMKTNWVWSDQLSGIGRINDYGYGDAYYVHIDDANPTRSFPGAWVNSVSPRPGVQIVGTPPNAYLDIRAVYVPSAHLGDSSLGGRHWLSGALQSNKFTFGYTESTVMQPSNDGAWPSDWTYAVPGGGGFDGTGTGPGNYWESDTFEKFGNSIGSDRVQQTTNSGRSTAMYVRPSIANISTQYHTYGQLWVPPILGKPAYMVFYVDRVATSTYLAPTGVGNMNMITNLEMGLGSSFVGATPSNQVVDLKVKNYFTWQPTGAPCDGNAMANTLPTPAPTATPIAPPPVASNIVPKLAPYVSPVIVTMNTQKLFLPTAPPNGALVLVQGISGNAGCPTGFKEIGWGDAYFCSGIVGQNGVVSATEYDVAGAGFDRSAIVYITGVTGYTINPDTSTGWHGESPVTLTKSQGIPAANGLELAFGYNLADAPRYASSVNYTSNLPFNTIYKDDGNSTYGRGMTLMETNVDPISAPGQNVSFTGSYTWAGPSSSVGNNLLPVLITVFVH